MKTPTTDVTIESYDRNAENYTEKFMCFEPYIEKMKVFQQSYLAPNSNILDVGCGPGNNAKFLIEIDGGYKIEGLDLSVELINIAKRNVPGCHFWVQDIRDINPDKDYDAIVASFCIVHLSDEETAVFLGKLSKMLKANGSLYLSFMEGKKAGFETTSFSEDNIFFNYHDRDVIKNLLAANSIETIEILNHGYQEQDGSVTEDIFVFARKVGASQ